MEQKTTLCDLSFLTKFTKGDAGKIAQYIKTYLRTSERIFSELEAASVNMNPEEIYVKAHTVKPQVQYMGIKSLQELLVKIEDLTRAGTVSSELKEMVNEALEIYVRSKDELKAKLSDFDAAS